MAPSPLYITTIVMPALPSFTRVFHHPSPTSFAGSVTSSSTVPPSTALIILLVFATLLALLGTCYIVWLCFRQRNRSAVGFGPAAMQTREMIRSAPGETHIIAKTWDSSQPFWTKCIMHSPDLMTVETKMSDALLSEVPKVWRILGRTNVAPEDSASEFGEEKRENREAVCELPNSDMGSGRS
ncbi:hypothetical protein DFH09DRAFT_1312986 [Mycena vulgaris]|nr:hypothetical protein DFH09DRAFT_1312986 [Mycena vulgaris]